MNAIYLFNGEMQEKKRDVHASFIDLEKSYDRILKQVIKNEMTRLEERQCHSIL